VRAAALLACLPAISCQQIDGPAPAADRAPAWAQGHRPIVNGTADTAPAHAAVVVLSVGMGMCSGTLVAPRIVLTAAHCVRGVAARYIRVGFGDDAESDSTVWVRASDAKAHPRFSEETLANDIGIIRLGAAPPEGVVPIPALPPELAMSAGDVGRTVLDFSGFGETEAGATGTKLHVTDTADLVCGDGRGCPMKGETTPPDVICYDQRPGGPCSGDSGGPAFVVRDGAEYVAGVTSFGDQQCAYFGCSTKVDAFADFIADFARGSVGSECTADTDCREGRCVDSICCEAGCDPQCGTCGVEGRLGTCTSVAEGEGCDDGNACTTGEACRGGRCAGARQVLCNTPPACRSAGACSRATGECAYPALADGAACDDGDACTGGESCRDGECVPQATTQCTAPDECHLARCNPDTGTCEAPAAPDGKECKGGHCDAGKCVPGCLGCNAGGVESVPVWTAVAILVRRRRVRRF